MSHRAGGEAVPGTAHRRGRVAAVVIAVVAALAVCVLQARLVTVFRSDPEPLMVPSGQQVEIDGARFGLTAMTRTEALPPAPDAYEGSPQRRALPGADLIEVELSVEVIDPQRDPTTVYCDFSLVGADGRIWQPNNEWGSAAVPEALGCGGPSDAEPVLGQPFTVGMLFEVPVEVADQVELRIDLSSIDRAVQFT